MDRQHVEEHAVIERYLQGKLTPAEQEAFEEAYLSDPRLLEQLELAERLQQGLTDLDRSEGLKRRRGSAWVASLSSPRYALAASILLVVSLAFSVTLYRENLSLQSGTSLVAGASMTRLQPLIAVRGTNVNVIPAAAEGELLVLLVDPGFGDYTTFRAAVVRQDPAPAETVWVATGLEPGYEDYLAIGVPGTLLGPGDYEVVVEGRMADWPAERDFDELSRVPMTVEARP